MFEIALSNHAVYAVACAKRRQRCPNHRNVRSKLFPDAPNGHRINEFASHIQIPQIQLSNSVSKLSRRIQRQPLINTKISSRRQANFETISQQFRSTRPTLEAATPASLSTTRSPLKNFRASPNHKRLYPTEQPPRIQRSYRGRPSYSPPTPSRTRFQVLSARRHGPCRNRTYNLAIKSRLLCQLS